MSDSRVLRIKADIEKAKREKLNIQALLKEIDARLTSAAARTKKLQDDRRKLCIKNADNYDQQEALQDEVTALKDVLHYARNKRDCLNHQAPVDEKDLARISKEVTTMDEDMRTQNRKLEKLEKALEDQRLQTRNNYTDVHNKTTEIHNHRNDVHKDKREKTRQETLLAREEDLIKVLTKELAAAELEAKEQAKERTKASSSQPAVAATTVTAPTASGSGGPGDLLGPDRLAVLNLFPQGADEARFVSRETLDGPVKTSKLKPKGGTFSINGISFKYAVQADSHQVIISELTSNGHGKAQLVVL